MSIVRTKKFDGNKVGELIIITKPDHYDETLEICKPNDMGYIVEIDPEDYQRYKVEFTNGEIKWISKQTEFVKAVDILQEVLKNDERVIE